MDIHVKDDEDHYTYMMEIFDNGRVDLLVRTQKHEQILFRGKLVIEDEKEQQQMYRPSHSLRRMGMD